ncbi:hypothetical protein Vadar_019325 [Vaccinium darrowii]|uniref:Uncharacterized protein n=1 Tax=Vaccinium darrowii TaxID=229202 RepID=A0ACB7YMT4_9ERIC|nr:hypothetical protein Vadar_019325 [Vaccinium darrowii]
MALALGLAVPTTFYFPTRLPSQIRASRGSIHGRVLHTFQCMAVSLQACEQKIVRRSANYQPTIWDYDYVQSLNSKYAGDAYAKPATNLKEDVKIMLDKVADPLAGLEMIDDLQRLGVFYHFEEEIKRVLEKVNNSFDNWSQEDLHAIALKFRLMRQHGYNIDQGVFNPFKDESGDFKACLGEDVKGMLCLYEASYLSVEGESTLEEARDFATKNLRQRLKRKDIHHDLAMLVSHALELPLHWRVPRLEARWFIDVYEGRLDMHPTLLQLAKLDYNIVQATHQADLKHASRWWRCTGLGEKLSFARDRLMESFLWTVEVDFRPQFGYRRRAATIVNALITVIDDIYDVYGTLDELELFTDAVESTNPITMEGLEWLDKYPNIVRWSATILRLADDLGTSSDEMKRGDTPKSIQCYMHETGASEEEAREHIKYLIGEAWKKMNKDQGVESPCSQIFVEIAMNLGRMAQCMYQYGDGHGAQGVESKDRVLSLLINPVPLT